MSLLNQNELQQITQGLHTLFPNPRECIGGAMSPNDRILYDFDHEGKPQCYNVTKLAKNKQQEYLPPSVAHAVHMVGVKVPADQHHLQFNPTDDRKSDGAKIATYLGKLNPSAAQVGTVQQIKKIEMESYKIAVDPTDILETVRCGQLMIDVNFTINSIQCQSTHHLVLEIHTDGLLPDDFTGLQEAIHFALIPILDVLETAIQHISDLSSEVSWKQKGLSFRVCRDDKYLRLISLFDTLLLPPDLKTQIALLLRAEIVPFLRQLANRAHLTCSPNVLDYIRDSQYYFRPEMIEGYLFRRNGGKYWFQEELPHELASDPFVADTEKYINLWRNMSFSLYEILARLGREFSFSQAQACSLLMFSLRTNNNLPLRELFSKLVHENNNAATKERQRTITDLEFQLFRCVTKHDKQSAAEHCWREATNFERVYPDIVKSMRYLRSLPNLSKWIINMYSVNDAAFNDTLKMIAGGVTLKGVYPGHWKLVHEMDEILEHAPHTTRPLFLFRGIDVMNPKAINIKPQTFSSVSYSYKVAEEFAGSTCCMMVIRVPIGTPITAIDEFSHFHTLKGSEYEIILPRNSIFVEVTDPSSQVQFQDELHKFLGYVRPTRLTWKLYDLDVKSQYDSRLRHYVEAHPITPTPNFREGHQPFLWNEIGKINEGHPTPESVDTFLKSDEFDEFIRKYVINIYTKYVLKRYGLIDNLEEYIATSLMMWFKNSGTFLRPGDDIQLSKPEGWKNFRIFHTLTSEDEIKILKPKFAKLAHEQLQARQKQILLDSDETLPHVERKRKRED